MKTRQEKLLGGLLLAELTGVEIGPLSRPLVAKDVCDVVYVDFADAEKLKANYANDPNVNVADILVDAIWGESTLRQAIDRYLLKKGRAAQDMDFVVASHVIEHVPDLVTWLREIRSVLKPSGQVRLAVPDKRFTFDYCRRTTELANVLAAYLSKARIPNTQCLLDFCLNQVSVDAAAAWAGPLDVNLLKKAHTVEGALWVARDALHNGNYHDVHCWVFTPQSFANLFLQLAEAELIDFACLEFYDTEVNTLEFIVNLCVSDDRQQTVQSWRRMAAHAGHREFELAQSSCAADYG